MDSSRWIDEPDEPGGGQRPRVRPDDPSMLRSLWEWTRSVLIAFVVFLGVRAFLVEAFKIPTGSMEGTLMVGDFLLVNKAVYGAEIPGTELRLPALDEPERGEVIVFHPPHEPRKNYVKRLVGMPGDTLAMVEKVLVVNGVEVDEPYVHYVDPSGDARHPNMKWQANHLIAGPSNYVPSRDTWGPLVVPEDAYFVLGDNRDNSEDSRYWGFVRRDAIRGRPWFVYYSFDPGASEALAWLKAVRWDRIGQTIR